MGEYLDSLHEAHKARQSRLKEAAFRSVTEPDPIPISEPETDIIEAIEEQIVEEIATPRYRTTFEIILREVCTYYNVRKIDIISPRRFNNYAINKIINNIKSHQSDIDELEKRIVEILEQRKAFALAERK